MIDTTVRARIDKRVKTEAAHVLEGMGLTRKWRPKTK